MALPKDRTRHGMTRECYNFINSTVFMSGRTYLISVGYLAPANYTIVIHVSRVTHGACNA